MNQTDLYIEENNHNKNNDKRFSNSYLITFQSWSSDQNNLSFWLSSCPLISLMKVPENVIIIYND